MEVSISEKDKKFFEDGTTVLEKTDISAKTKIYRILGLILLAWGIVGFYCYLVQKVAEPEENAGVIFSYPSVMGILSMYIINPIFWFGWFILNKVTKSDHIIKKPAWSQWLLRSYIICGFFLGMLLIIMCIGILITS